MAEPLPCPHGMPSAPSCTTCIEDGPVYAPARRWEGIGHPFPAKFSATCERCDEDYTPGDWIAREDRGTERTRYVHEECRSDG